MTLKAIIAARWAENGVVCENRAVAKFIELPPLLRLPLSVPATASISMSANEIDEHILLCFFRGKSRSSLRPWRSAPAGPGQINGQGRLGTVRRLGTVGAADALTPPAVCSKQL